LFYVYDIEGDKVSAIAQYNLYVGNSCTSSSSSSYDDPEQEFVYVIRWSDISPQGATTNYGIGVRPVIAISKSLF